MWLRCNDQGRATKLVNLGFINRALPRLRRLGVYPERGSVRAKLLRLVLSTTAFSLLIAGTLLLARDLTVYRHSWVSDLASEADVLALSIAPTLAFDDRAAAERNLRALRMRPRVLGGAIYDAKGRLYAQYSRLGARPPSSVPTTLFAHGNGSYSVTSGERIELFAPVHQNGEYLGTVYLQARYDLGGRVLDYLSIFAMVMLAGLTFAYILSDRLQRSITTPLDAMAGVARRIVQQRDYSLRAPQTTEDEIGVVVAAFNKMLDEVQASARKLDEADRRKDEFLATLAHELRNPLAPIRYAASILDQERAHEQQKKWARGIIARQVQRMALLLDDLIDVSRITRGRLELKTECIDLADTIAAAVETARPLIEAKEHTLEVRLPRHPVRLKADALRLSQAVSNVLTNAAKYTNAKGRIVLTATLGPEELTITVSDTGIGLSAQAIPKLFEMFTQVDPERAEGGLGIGLALVKGLVSLHGGSVDAASPGLGQGSTFTLHLPRSLVLEERSGAEREEPAEGPAESASLAILVADDNRDVADTLAEILRISGKVVHVAYSGLEVLQIGARERPSIVILDIGMPGMNGYETATRIRKQSWGKSALLLAVTGWGQVQDRDKAAAAGFDHHLTKPADPQQIEQLIAQFVSGRTAEEARSGDCQQG